ncbi:MAG TPA: GntR family transcriptional regulator [Acidimicrobiaceae bacterium]|jgi:GntR family transcriptional regulator|nr:GntR family transcriptional regulator [Acidimicrobiaceae bacterium]
MRPTVSIDSHSPTPPFEQLRNQLDEQIRQGFLAAGHQLPTVRQLAADLGLAKNTVVRAYRALERDGLVIGDRRRGTLILERQMTANQRDQILAAAAQRFLNDLTGIDATLEEATAVLQRMLCERAAEDGI